MYEASAPGSIMLLGEHAVLHGYPAVVTAIDQQIKVQLIPRQDKKIIIRSALGEHQTQLDAINPVKPFDLVLTTIQQAPTQLHTGFELIIKSEFSDTVGLGSSAAVTVATVAVIHRYCGINLESELLFARAKEVILAVQGSGSAADVAASIFGLGGSILYRAEPFSIEKLPHQPAVSLIYCGYKTPTAEVIRLIDEKQQADEEKYNKLFAAIGQCAQQGADAIKQANWPQLGAIFNKQQDLMEALGVSDDTLNKIISHARAQTAVLGAKISGSGLGDCVVVLNDVCLFK